MRKLTKFWLVIAASLILIGAGIFTSMLANSNWDIGRMSTLAYKTNVYTSFEQFQNISIETMTADISFIFTEIDCSRVVCYEMEKAPHTVSFDGEKLTIKQTDHRLWYDHLGINFDMPEIKIYLPKSNYGALNIATTTSNISIPANFQFESVNISGTTGDIKCNASTSGVFKAKMTTGDLTLDNISVGSLDFTATTGKTNISDVLCYGDMHINVSTGKMDLTNVKCNGLNTKGTTGDISMDNFVAEDHLIINRTTGDVRFKESDASLIHIELDTGNVNGNLLTGKEFTVNTSTGRTNIPDNSPGGTCIVKTSTGNIKITVG